MEFRVLGSLEVRQDDSTVMPGSFKQRSLLALLLIHANQVVSTDRIIDELWGDQLVSGRQNALWVHVSNLRSELEPNRPPRSEGTVLLTRPPGYVLEVDPRAIDAHRFEQLVVEGRGLLEVDPSAASLVLGESLALWRGTAYADVMYESFAQLEIGRLQELRLEAVELRVDADLRRGLAAELVGELESLAGQHPLRERLTAHLMLALYRSGRHGESLRALARLRTRLRDEMGIEPSGALLDLERRILAGDESLAEPGGSPGPRRRLAVRGYEIREPIRESPLGVTYRAYQPAVGREVAIKIVRSDVANDATFIRRFEAEAELVARLEHPHILPVYDYWREPDAAYLVTRTVRGGTLAEVARDRPLTPRNAARVITEVGSALVLAHRHGVVHGDVTPVNVLVDDDGAAYLGDFSFALDRSESVAADRDDSDSPPRLPLSAASDVRGLASLLAYALSGGVSDPNGGGALPAHIPAQLGAVVHKGVAADPAERFADVASFLEAMQTAIGAEVARAALPAANPYKGLRAFEEADAAVFFGRERLVDRLLTRLGGPGVAGRFLAVVGPSGCGKSSVVHAGLVPAVRDGAVPGSSEWFITGFAPGRRPYEELEAALMRVAVDPPSNLIDRLSDGEAAIRRSVQRLLPDPCSQLLLVIDQFEELFTQTPPATAEAFLNALADAVDDPRTQLRVVITLRADFYDRPLRHRNIGELLRRGTEVVTPMSPDEVERAVSEPAEQAGVAFERGLVAEIVADIAEHPDALPLLQYALTELYDRRRHQTMELTAYRDLGGLAAALAQRAEALYAEFDADAKDTARQLLLRLVTLGEGTEDLRRRVPRQDLGALGGSAVDLVLDTLGRHRLLSFDRDPVTRGPTVQIAHEALLTEWHRLRSWIDSSRDDLRLERVVASAAAEWQAADRHSDYLLTGARLDRLTDWAAATDVALDPGERAFLAAGVARRAHDRAVEDRRRREEDRLRERSRARTRMLFLAAAVLMLVAALATYAVVQRNDAQRFAGELADTAEARRLASASTLIAEENPDLAMLLALQSVDASAEAGIPALVEAEEALHWSLQAAAVAYGHPEAPVEVRVGPNGPTGIPRLPMHDLIALARGHLGGRVLTTTECTQHQVDPCPSPAEGVAWPRLPREPTRPPLPIQDERPLAGSRVTITGAMEPDAVRRDLDVFQELTGIEVEYRQPTSDVVDERDSAGVPIDLGVLGRASDVQDAADAGELIDLETFLDVDDARDEFGDYFVDAAVVGDQYFAVPMYGGLKAVVWYPLRQFTAASYTAPRTWDELVALSEQMVADGNTAWCIGFESEGWSGWPGTDWIEALVMRVGGVDAYDRWMAGDVEFSDPIVREAFTRFGQIAFGEGFVRYGTDAISRTSHFDAMDHLATEQPGCWMHSTGSWMPNNVRAASGGEVGFFVLPPLAAGGDAPVIGSAAMVGAFRDRPEIREFIRWLHNPEWGALWAADPDRNFLSPNVHFDPANCRADGFSDDANSMRVALCDLQRETLAAGLQRFDASDEMPSNVGAAVDGQPRGLFLQAMLDYVDEGPANLDQLLTTIDATWRDAADG